MVSQGVWAGRQSPMTFRILEVAPPCSAVGLGPLLPSVAEQILPETALPSPAPLLLGLDPPSSPRDHPADRPCPAWPCAPLCWGAVSTSLSLRNSCALFSTDLRYHLCMRASYADLCPPRFEALSIPWLVFTVGCWDARPWATAVWAAQPTVTWATPSYYF